MQHRTATQTRGNNATKSRPVAHSCLLMSGGWRPTSNERLFVIGNGYDYFYARPMAAGGWATGGNRGDERYERHADARSRARAPHVRFVCVKFILIMSRIPSRMRAECVRHGAPLELGGRATSSAYCIASSVNCDLCNCVSAATNARTVQPMLVFFCVCFVRLNTGGGLHDNIQL